MTFTTVAVSDCFMPGPKQAACLSSLPDVLTLVTADDLR
jgi:hypothetical protein